MSQLINFIKLDFNRSNDITIPTIELDQGSRFVRVQLQNNNQSVDITGSQVAITVIRNDLEEIIESCNILDAKEGLIEFEISKSMVARQGDMLCQLKLSDNDSVLSSQLFKISVNNTLTFNLEESRSEMDVLINALGEVQDIDNRFKETNRKVDENYEKVNAQLSDKFISVKNFGAVGDGLTYDDDAINEAYKKASELRTSLFFPSGTYRTKTTLVFNKQVDIKMRGMIQQDKGLNMPIVVVGGDTGTSVRQVNCIIKARRNPDGDFENADWCSDNNVAVIVKNIQNSTVTIEEASYCTVGVSLLGDYSSVSYSTINLNNITNNKIGVKFGVNGTKEDMAFVTELVLNGGRITKNKNLNINQTNYGVVASVEKDQHMIDNIRWYNPCFELQKYGTSESNENIVFNLTYCNDFKVINFRAEKIRSNYLGFLTKCIGVELVPSALYDAPRSLYFNELATWDDKRKLTNKLVDFSKEQELINVDIINSFFYERKKYGSDNVNKKIMLKPPLLSVNFDYKSSITSPHNFTYETIDVDREILTNRGFRLLSNNANQTNIGVRIITGGHKFFKLETNSCPAIAVLCYNSEGVYLSPTESEKYAYFYRSNIKNFNGNDILITKDDTYDDAKKYPQKEVEIIITSDSVASFIVLLVGNDKNTTCNYVSVMKIKAVYANGEVDCMANPSVDCGDFSCKPFPSQGSKPVGFGQWGEIIYNSSASYGQDIGWICMKSGEEDSVWRSIGKIGDE